MRRPSQLLLLVGVLLLTTSFLKFEGTPIASRIVDLRKEHITLRWKDPQGHVIGDLGALRTRIAQEGSDLLFAMNGGMYTHEQGPVGLYIEDGKVLNRIDRRTDPKDNFHMQPNGVFGLYNDGSAFVKTTTSMKDMVQVRYATQSGPMLLSGGVINKNFTPGSKNLHIRNGVGIRTDGNIVFAISREPINFHDFATWFKAQGCDDALYLDGFVSKAYMPEAGLQQMDGQLGVLIAVTAR
ncbi:MAG: phosphodiester glycosidase family protein [Flavobacteriales bacterium]|nr:phosphodiester glycosidase family protein [Flavobacteriales bacterium]